MKKSVVTLIAIIYVASIVLVTFFGLQHNTFFEDIKVGEVKITNEGISYKKDGTKYVVLDAGLLTYQIEYKLSPDNAVNKEVEFIIHNLPEGVSVDENGLVTFPEDDYPITVVVYVVSKDSNGAWDKISITSWPVEFAQ